MAQQLSMNEDSQQQYVPVKSNRSKLSSSLRRHLSILQAETRQLFTFQPTKWRNAFRPNSFYPLFQKGDLDGLVALFIDNMATLLTIILILRTVLDADIVFGKIAPGYILIRLMDQN